MIFQKQDLKPLSRDDAEGSINILYKQYIFIVYLNKLFNI